MRPLKKPRIYARILNGTDARTVRPYIPTSAVLMHKMADEVSYSNACWDARSVRPLAKPCIYARILNGTDARTVRPYIPLAHKSSYLSANPKVQCSKFNVQRQQILKFNIQNSMFKGKVPTSLYRPYYAIIAALRLFRVGLGAGQKNIPAVPKDYRETPHVGVDGFEPPTLCL